MWAKLLGVVCAGVFVGAFMVELARTNQDKAAERISDRKKRARRATATSA